MKTYACDKCGAEFYVADDSYDDICPECYSDQTVLLFDEKGFGGEEAREDADDDFDADDDDEFEDEFEDELDAELDDFEDD